MALYFATVPQSRAGWVVFQKGQAIYIKAIHEISCCCIILVSKHSACAVTDIVYLTELPLHY